jgi:hypothetical protein
MVNASGWPAYAIDFEGERVLLQPGETFQAAMLRHRAKFRSSPTRTDADAAPNATAPDPAVVAHRRQVAELKAECERLTAERQALELRVEKAALEEQIAKQARKERGFAGRIRVAGGVFNAIKRRSGR